MSASVYRSEEGRQIIGDAYRAHLRSEAAAGLTQITVDTPCGETFVIEKIAPGKPPLVLLHGSVSNSASWLGVIPLFAEAFSVYCVDIPGEPGASTPERFALASDAPQRWLGGTLDALGVSESAFLGMSLGGWYALNLAVRDPARVSALSMISTGGIGPQNAAFIFKALFFLLLGKAGRRMLNRSIYRGAVVPEEILEYQAVVSKHFRPVTEPLPIFADDELSRLPMPVQYIGGAEDVLIDTRKAAARLEALVPHADVRLLENTGHAVTDRFGEVREFLVGALD